MIRIAKLTDYAIVLLTYFSEDSGQVYNARDLAAQSGLSLPTVSKILKALSRGALLVSHRGVKGGYSLARHTNQISIAEVISAVEGPVSMTECSATAPGLCDLEPMCPVRTNWQRINRTVRQALEGLTLADMAQPRAANLAQRKHEQPPLSLVTRKSV